MDLDEALNARRSIRAYSRAGIDLKEIVEVCEAARYAPMAGNVWSVQLLVVSDKNKKAELAQAALGQEFVQEAPYVIVVCSEVEKVKRAYGKRAEIYARQQAGAVIENMLLKAASLGLGCCWVGAFDENAVKQTLKIPDKVQIEALIPIGKPREKPKPKAKPELKLILHFEQWGQKVAKPERKPG